MYFLLIQICILCNKIVHIKHILHIVANNFVNLIKIFLTLIIINGRLRGKRMHLLKNIIKHLRGWINNMANLKDGEVVLFTPVKSTLSEHKYRYGTDAWRDALFDAWDNDAEQSTIVILKKLLCMTQEKSNENDITRGYSKPWRRTNKITTHKMQKMIIRQLQKLEKEKKRELKKQLKEQQLKNKQK